MQSAPNCYLALNLLRYLAILLALVSVAGSAEVRRTPPIGPAYVPLDSWVYPVVKRLAAMGYAPDVESLVAPWTREQCSILVAEAEDIALRHSTKVEMGATNQQALKLISALKAEFEPGENPRTQARIESLYTRLSQITGSPLADSYHFGQTIVNDYGRPYQSGTNSIDGISGFATAGRFSGYFRGEYQEAGGRSAYDQGVRDLIGQLDGVAPQPAAIVRPVNKFDPLEMYVGVKLGVFDVTVGKQSTWWGPGEESAFGFSNNAEPLYAAKVAQQTPIVLPGPLRLLGHIRTQLMIGRLSGHAYPPKPFINAEKITFQLTKNLEVGFTRSSIFGGVGHPLTTGSFLQSFVSVNSSGGTAFGARNDPG